MTNWQTRLTLFTDNNTLKSKEEFSKDTVDQAFTSSSISFHFPDFWRKQRSDTISADEIRQQSKQTISFSWTILNCTHVNTDNNLESLFEQQYHQSTRQHWGIQIPRNDSEQHHQNNIDIGQVLCAVEKDHEKEPQHQKYHQCCQNDFNTNNIVRVCGTRLVSHRARGYRQRNQKRTEEISSPQQQQWR